MDIHTIKRILKPNGILAAAALLVFVFLLIFPAFGITAVNSALTLCAASVIPSLFPFFVLNNILIASGFPEKCAKLLDKPFRFLFGISGSGAAAFLLGALSGYPNGARCASELYERGLCTADEAERLLAFCNNTSPAFLIGFVGSTLFGSPRTGALLYLVQLIAAIVTGILEHLFFRDAEQPFRAEKPLQEAGQDPGRGILPSAIRDAVFSILTVCGSVLFFSVLLALLSRLLRGHMQLYLGCCALLELTSACAEAAALLPRPIAILVTAAAVSWSGCSVHAQTASFVYGKLSLSRYFGGKLLCCVITVLLTACFLFLFP